MYGQPKFIARARATDIIAALQSHGFVMKDMGEWSDSDGGHTMNFTMTFGLSDDECELSTVNITLERKAKNA